VAKKKQAPKPEPNALTPWEEIDKVIQEQTRGKSPEELRDIAQELKSRADKLEAQAKDEEAELLDGADDAE